MPSHTTSVSRELDLGAFHRLQQLITFDHVLFMADGYTVTPCSQYIHSHTWFTSPFPPIFVCDQRSLVSIQLSHAAVSIFLQLYLSTFLSPDLLPMAIFLVTLFRCGLAVHTVVVCHYGVVSKLEFINNPHVINSSNADWCWTTVQTVKFWHFVWRHIGLSYWIKLVTYAFTEDCWWLKQLLCWVNILIVTYRPMFRHTWNGC